MPAVKMGRDNTSRNLSRLIYGRVKERDVKLDDLLKPAGVSSKTTLQKWMKDPQDYQMKGVKEICKRLGISREEFFAAFDY